MRLVKFRRVNFVEVICAFTEAMRNDKSTAELTSVLTEVD